MKIGQEMTCSLNCDMAYRGRIAADSSFAPCTFASNQSSTKEGRENRASISTTLSNLQGGRNLPLNLRLTWNQRIEPAGNPKDVRDGLLIYKAVAMAFQFITGNLTCLT